MMKFPTVYFLTIFLLLTKFVSAQENKVLYKSNSFILYGNRLVQGKYTAKALSATQLESNYKSTENNKEKTAASWKLSKDIAAFPKYQS